MDFNNETAAVENAIDFDKAHYDKDVFESSVLALSQLGNQKAVNDYVHGYIQSYVHYHVQGVSLSEGMDVRSIGSEIYDSFSVYNFWNTLSEDIKNSDACNNLYRDMKHILRAEINSQIVRKFPELKSDNPHHMFFTGGMG